MRAYFQRLKTHPGLTYGYLFTVMGALAGAQNTSFHPMWHGAVFGLLALGVPVWAIILISNRNRK